MIHGTASKLLRRMVGVWLAATSVGVAAPTAALPAWSLMPQPAQMRPAASGSLTIAENAEVAVRGADLQQVQSIAGRFVQLLADTGGLHLHVAKVATAHPAITFELDPHVDVVEDAGYRIVVGNQGIHVIARTPRGAFYGSVTLWQLLTPPGWTRGTPVEVADGVIDDHPRFAWRALLLDSGRHFQSAADVRKLIDWMSLNKLNVLLWHVTEDQGWRLEIPKYPELAKVGACRKAVGLDAELTGSADKPYCGSYTEAEVRDIVRLPPNATCGAGNRSSRPFAGGHRSVPMARCHQPASDRVDRLGRQPMAAQSKRKDSEVRR